MHASMYTQGNIETYRSATLKVYPTRLQRMFRFAESP